VYTRKQWGSELQTNKAFYNYYLFMNINIDLEVLDAAVNSERDSPPKILLRVGGSRFQARLRLL
jgi:hypothetical protein